MEDIFSFEVETIDGKKTSLEQYRGKVLLIVNVASKCGFTSQYEGLEELYTRYFDRGLVILGFPCNQFGGQEPGSEQEIMEFCRLNYAVSFPMFAKIEVNGEGAHQLYKHLKQERPGLFGSNAVKWNFTKFLVDQEGNVVRRFAPTTTPAEIEKEILRLLQERV